MTIDLRTAEANLVKAREDAAFWENAIKILRDPRISGALPHSDVAGFSFVQAPVLPTPRPYGELKKRVYEALPNWGIAPVNTNQLVDTMERSGFVFTSKTPSISVNEALVNLETEGLAFMAYKSGVSRFWTKTQKKDQGTAEAVP